MILLGFVNLHDLVMTGHFLKWVISPSENSKFNCPRRRILILNPRSGFRLFANPPSVGIRGLTSLKNYFFIARILAFSFAYLYATVPILVFSNDAGDYGLSTPW